MMTSNNMYIISQVTELASNLYLTSIYGATKENILRRNITLLINAAQELPKMDLPGVESIKLFLDDTPHALASAYFDRMSDKINEHLINGGRALVHCVLGISRSTSIILAYLMKYKHMSLKQAYDYVQSRRSVARPNPGFWRQLIDYEKRLTHQKQTQAKLSTQTQSNSTSIPITIIKTNQELQQQPTTVPIVYSSSNQDRQQSASSTTTSNRLSARSTSQQPTKNYVSSYTTVPSYNNIRTNILLSSTNDEPKVQRQSSYSTTYRSSYGSMRY